MPYSKTLIGATLIVFILMAVGLYWQHSTIASQRTTLAENAKTIESLNTQIKVKEDVALAHKKERDKSQRERDGYKQRLEDAEKLGSCFNTPLSPDGKRVLEELYSGKASL